MRGIGVFRFCAVVIGAGRCSVCSSSAGEAAGIVGRKFVVRFLDREQVFSSPVISRLPTIYLVGLRGVPEQTA
jgi:hypothetical protein